MTDHPLDFSEPQHELVDWCFDNTERPDLWDDPHRTRVMLVDVMTGINEQFTARNAQFSDATSARLDKGTYRALRTEHGDWRRRAAHVKRRVESRLREVNELIAQEGREQHERSGGVHPERIVGIARRLYDVIGEFLDEYEYLVDEAERAAD